MLTFSEHSLFFYTFLYLGCKRRLIRKHHSFFYLKDYFKEINFKLTSWNYLMQSITPGWKEIQKKL